MRIGTAQPMWCNVAALVGLVAFSGTAKAVVSIDVGSASGAPGSTVPFQVSVSAGGAQVGGLGNTIAFDSVTPISKCTINPALSLSGWSLQPTHCTPLVDCVQANFLIIAFGFPIPDGIMYQCDVKIAADAAGGSFPLTCSGVSAFDTSSPSKPLDVQCHSGQVNVLRPCAGDCNGDGVVTIDELLTSVGIGLGTTPIQACPAIGGGASGASVVQVLTAVRNVLSGCPPSGP